MSAKVRTCLWFERDGMAAARFYVSLLPDSRIEQVAGFEDPTTGDPQGVMLIDFTLAGAPYQILAAGPHQAHNDMASILVLTDDQAETDRLWTALTADGGQPVQCGWLKDRWGIAWQIVPRALGALMSQGDAAAAGRVQAAMLAMQKLDIAALEAAHRGDEG